MSYFKCFEQYEKVLCNSNRGSLGGRNINQIKSIKSSTGAGLHQLTNTELLSERSSFLHKFLQCNGAGGYGTWDSTPTVNPRSPQSSTFFTGWRPGSPQEHLFAGATLSPWLCQAFLPPPPSLQLPSYGGSRLLQPLPCSNSHSLACAMALARPCSFTPAWPGLALECRLALYPTSFPRHSLQPALGTGEGTQRPGPRGRADCQCWSSEGLQDITSVQTTV